MSHYPYYLGYGVVRAWGQQMVQILVSDTFAGDRSKWWPEETI